MLCAVSRIGCILQSWITSGWQLHYGRTVPEFARRQGVEIDFEHRNVNSGISPEVASCIYRVAQEALWNVAKHSKAKKASVRVSATARFVRLVVRDNGIGFHPERVGAGQSLGLTSMEERSRLLNGKFSVVSSPGLGTTLTLPFRSRFHRNESRTSSSGRRSFAGRGRHPQASWESVELIGVVTDGLQLVEAVTKNEIDVVLLDISMPLLNGIDAARQVKKIHRVRSLSF